MRYLYLVNKHQAWEHTSSRTTSWHWSSVILFQHNKRGWNGMIFFFFEGMTSCDRNMGLKENRKRERVKMSKGARDDRKWGRGLFLLDCFWKLQMFPQLYRGKNLPQRFFFSVRREEKRPVCHYTSESWGRMFVMSWKLAVVQHMSLQAPICYHNNRSIWLNISLFNFFHVTVLGGQWI